MRNYAQMRLDMRKHATAREIARMCTLGGRLGGGGRIAARRLLLNVSAAVMPAAGAECLP